MVLEAAAEAGQDEVTLSASAAADLPPGTMLIVVHSGGGRFVVRGGELAVLEGDWDPSRLVILEFDRAHVDHAAHVVDAVHSDAVPIIPSRVTRAARASSDRPSVPGGRCGSTR